MILEKVVLSLYETSKSTEPQLVQGTFEVLSSTRSGRTKILNKDTEKEYWIDTEVLNAKVAEESEPEVPSVEEVNSMVTVDLPQPVLAGMDLAPTDDCVSYIVGRGDTLYSIADKFGVSPSTIVSLNGSDTFAIGRTIRIK